MCIHNIKFTEQLSSEFYLHFSMEPKALSKHQAYNITITSAGPGKKDKLKKFKLNERPKSRNHKREKHLDRIVQSARYIINYQTISYN